MDRRKFMGAGSLALASLAFPKILRAGAAACSPATSPDLYGYGPYYLEGAPDRLQLAGAGEPGKPLSIDGKVTDCGGPAKNVVLEVWHATDSGCYIHPSQPTCPDHGNPAVSRLWARLVTDAEGRFSFSTIKPGVYLNGSAYRPSHIHFRIRSPQGTANPVDLVTQLYFQGDPYIPGDYGASDPNAKARIIPLVTVEGLSALAGTFNVQLPGGTTSTGHRMDPLSDPAMGTYDIFVQKRGWNYLFHLPPLPSAQPVEFRLYDAAGILVKRSLHTVTPVELDATLLGRGAYQAEFRWWTSKGQRIESVAVKN